MVEKTVLMLLLISTFLLIEIYSNINSINRKNNEINSMNSTLSDAKQKLSDIKKNENSIGNANWINYDLWVKQCASIGNSYIYDKTNNLKILSEKSQGELDSISKEFKISIDNYDYSKIVKFIIIDKNKNTFITNDIENIDLIKNSFKVFEQETGDLYKYVSSKGKWYNLSYNSDGAPAGRYGSNHSIINSSNYVEAYWFPNNYVYSREDEPLLKNILQVAEHDYNNEINSVSEGVSNTGNSIIKDEKYIAIYSSILFLILMVLYFLGEDRFIRGLKNNLIIKFFMIINQWFENRTTLFKITVYFLFTFSVIMALWLMYNHGMAVILLPLVLFYAIVILPKIIGFSRYIDEIIQGTAKITSGELNYVLKEKGDRSLAWLSHNINKINKGFKVSIEDQIKNEKLKSELVANVSHDLKTPLTSIINYTDILLRENISEEEKKEFLNILNRKSIKLKTLIEDLFEISKINSGKLELNKKNVDVIELINQSISEYSDSELYSNKNLKFIVRSFSKKIDMSLDGNKMSRVFENLITNALKYSLANTRVYVDIDDIHKGIKISFKNVSSVPLDFDKKEIFERFTRGDISRSSDVDGNGLGLAIAKSIVELHGGIMYIDFDGDLFKAVTELYY